MAQARGITACKRQPLLPPWRHPEPHDTTPGGQFPLLCVERGVSVQRDQRGLVSFTPQQ